VLTKPKTEITIDKELMRDCELYWYMTGTIPDPDFIRGLPIGYLEQLLAYRHGIRFFEDYSKRPTNMR
jgi:hypothetical protein